MFRFHLPSNQHLRRWLEKPSGRHSGLHDQRILMAVHYFFFGKIARTVVDSHLGLLNSHLVCHFCTAQLVCGQFLENPCLSPTIPQLPHSLPDGVFCHFSCEAFIKVKTYLFFLYCWFERSCPFLSPPLLQIPTFFSPSTHSHFRWFRFFSWEFRNV